MSCTRYNKALGPNGDLTVALKLVKTPRSRIRTAALTLARVGFVTFLDDTSSSAPSGGAAEKNAELRSQGCNPAYFVGATQALTMASELIALVRQLCGDIVDDEGGDEGASPGQGQTPSQASQPATGSVTMGDAPRAPPSSQPTASWASTVRAVVAKAAEEDLAAVAAALPDDGDGSHTASAATIDPASLWRALAAMSVLGGFSEPLRLGCRVVVSVGGGTAAARAASEADLSSETGELHVGTLVGYEQGRRTASVVFEDESAAPVTVDVAQLTAVPDVRAAQAGFGLSTSLLSALMAFFRKGGVLGGADATTALADAGAMGDAGSKTPHAVDAPAASADGGPHDTSTAHVAQLRARSMRALWSLLQDEASARTLLSGDVPGALGLLLRLAQTSSPGRTLATEEAAATLLLRRSLDLRATQRPLSLSAVAHAVRNANSGGDEESMAAVLPHFKHAALVKSLPTGFSRKHCAYVYMELVSGVARRVQSCARTSERRGDGRWSQRGGRAPRSSSRTADTRVGVVANGIVPLSLPEYYFEVRVENVTTESAGIQIGLLDESGLTQSSTGKQPRSSRDDRRGGGGGGASGGLNWSKGWFAFSSMGTTHGPTKDTQYSEPFADGDVVGCRWDLRHHNISFTRNGMDLGVAFTGVDARRMVPTVRLGGERDRVLINFGQEPLLFTLPDVGEDDDEARKVRGWRGRDAAVPQTVVAHAFAVCVCVCVWLVAAGVGVVVWLPAGATGGGVEAGGTGTVEGGGREEGRHQDADRNRAQHAHPAGGARR